MLTSRFSFFGSGDQIKVNNENTSSNNNNNNRTNYNYLTANDSKSEIVPRLKLRTDKNVYRPGDSILITIEIELDLPQQQQQQEHGGISLLIERLGIEIKGIQKLDPQWFATQKPSPGSKLKRGEHCFMDGSCSSLITNHIALAGTTKAYIVRSLLPAVIPPSFKGAAIRYLYFVKSTLLGRWLMLENGHSNGESARDFIELEARTPLQIWVAQKSNGLLMEEGQNDALLPATTIQLDLYWKEMNGESDWARANDTDDGVEDGYDSSRDEISSVSSYNPTKETINKSFGSSLSLQSLAQRSSFRDVSYIEGRASLSSTVAPPKLSVAEVLYDSSGDNSSLPAVVSPSQQRKITKPQTEDELAGLSSISGLTTNESATSVGFIRGRSYNIRMDDQVLLRFSPKNSDSTYYFSDTIGGTLTFFHEEGMRRCLEVSITLEISETINRRLIHPSRRNSPTVTKVQSDHHEVVCDLVQTSFLFSVPMDGPMSFSTAHVSVQWALRFEFFTTPKNLDWTRYEHPLLISGRDKCEWVLPITVHAPPPRAPAHTRSEKSFTLEPLWDLELWNAAQCEGLDCSRAFKLKQPLKSWGKLHHVYNWSRLRCADAGTKCDSLIILCYFPVAI